jgi:hypothetical protein
MDNHSSQHLLVSAFYKNYATTEGDLAEFDDSGQLQAHSKMTLTIDRGLSIDSALELRPICCNRPVHTPPVAILPLTTCLGEVFEARDSRYCVFGSAWASCTARTSDL